MGCSAVCSFSFVLCIWLFTFVSFCFNFRFSSLLTGFSISASDWPVDILGFGFGLAEEVFEVEGVE